MAGIIGKRGSYGTISPIQGDPLGNALQDVEQNAFKYRAEKRLEDEAKAKKEKEALEDYAEWDGKFDPTIVGNSKIDDPMLSMAMKARDRADKIWRELKNPGLSFEQKTKLMSERNKLVQSFDVANQTPKMMLEKIKQIAKDYDKYDQQDLNLLENITRQLETGKYEVNYDDTGTARVKIYQTDESGKPVGVLKETTLADMANEFQPTLKSTYKEDLQKYAKDYEVSKTVTGDYSGRVIEDQRVNRKPGSRDYNNAMEYAKVIISKPNERKIIARNNNLDPNDEQGLLKFITNDILNAIPDNYSNKPDADLAFRRSQAKKEEAPAPRFTDLTVEDKEIVRTIGGKEIRVPRGTKNVVVEGYIDGDIKKGVYDRINRFQTIKGSDGRIRVLAEIESVGKNAGTETTTEFTESGKKQIKDYLAKNPTKTYQEATYYVSNTDPSSVLKVSEREKQNPKRFINIGANQALLSKFIPSEQTPDEVIREVIRQSGYNPDEASKPKEKPKAKSISRSQIAEKAKASGYSPREYEKLLKERGINITE